MESSSSEVEELARRVAEETAAKVLAGVLATIDERAAENRREMQEVVTSSVRQTLIRMGIDSDDPIAMQRDFQHLRRWRQAGEDLKSKGMMVLLSVFITGVVSLVLVGLRDWFTHGGK